MVDQNKEAQKLIHHMFDIVRRLGCLMNYLPQCEKANQVDGLEVMYIAIHKDTHFAGGSLRGRQFVIDQGSHIPYSFMGYLSGVLNKIEHTHNIYQHMAVVIIYILSVSGTVILMEQMSSSIVVYICVHYNYYINNISFTYKNSYN